MLGLLVLSSHDGTCGGRQSLLLRSDIYSALDVIQRHTHTPVLIDEDRLVRSGVLHQESGGAHLILKLFEHPSHTLPGNTQAKAWIQNARSLHSLQMEALALEQNIL